jgi:hypothetical protein
MSDNGETEDLEEVQDVSVAPNDSEELVDDIDIAFGQMVYELELTAPELIHLRDLLSIISPDMSKTLSQKLSVANGMGVHEAKLWKKICTACLKARIPVGSTAPDYLATDVSQPKIDIFPLNRSDVTTLSTKK